MRNKEGPHIQHRILQFFIYKTTWLKVRNMHSRISKGRSVVSKVLIHSKGREGRGRAFLYRYICRSAQIPVCCLPFVLLHSYSLLLIQMSWWNGMLYKNKYRQFQKNTETQNHNTCQSPDLHIQFCRTSVFKKKKHSEHRN